MKKILVTGATGNVGSRVVHELRGRGMPVRAFVRDAERAAGMLGEDVELAVGDFGDPASVRAALDGVDGVFLAVPGGPLKLGRVNAINAVSTLVGSVSGSMLTVADNSTALGPRGWTCGWSRTKTP